MTQTTPILLTGVGPGESNIARLAGEMLLKLGQPIRAMVHRDDDWADGLRARGADVVAGDLTRPHDIAAALTGVRRVFFNFPVSSDYVEAAAILASLALEVRDLEVLVNMSQMTVSQMTSTSSEESQQQRLHWLVEQMFTWSRLPVVTVRPTVFLDNPMFTRAPRQSIAENGVLALPIGRGKTSPVAATDVANVVKTVLRDPARHIGNVYELTGPEVLGIDELAVRYGRALGRPITGSDIPDEVYAKQLGSVVGIPPHVLGHLLTVAKLHRDDRYNRHTDDVRNVTGQAPESVEDYIASHVELFTGRLPMREFAPTSRGVSART